MQTSDAATRSFEDQIIGVLREHGALADVDAITHAELQDEGARLFLGAQHLNVPHTLELENV